MSFYWVWCYNSTMNTKTQITYQNRQVLVDTDMVKLMKRKEALVTEAMQIQVRGDTSIEARARSMKIASSIIRLNRRIRQNVIFL
jgi:hypothetical protein